MKKIIIGLVVLFLFSLFVFIQGDNEGKKEIEKKEEPFVGVLGYCPTQREEAIALAEERGLELLPLGSTGEVLYSLKINEIDFGLVGRKARSSEVEKGVAKEIIRDGYMLITKKSLVIDYKNLHHIEINTYVEEDVIDGLPLEDNKINYYKTKEEALMTIDDGAVVLLPWDDFEDDFNLLIVMDGGRKKKDFRGAFLYYKER